MVQQRPGVTGKPVRLAYPPSLLAGRSELLAELSARLMQGDRASPRTVALWGMGGVGKTSAAVAYARRHLADVGLVWQFKAYDRTALEAEFSELAAQLGARDIADTRDPVASVHGVLAAFPAQWLLLFDNVPDWASVERFLPPAGPGRILITSQNPSWPHGQALEVSLLAPEVAADFVVTRTGDQDQQAAQELAVVMGGLPLALEQAAAYVLATGGTLAGYLGLFRQRRAEMLRRGEPTGYPGTVATTWALAFSRLEESSPAAVGLLRLLGFCAPEAIPLRLLLQPRPGLADRLGSDVAPVLVPILKDALAVDEGLAELRRYSLVSLAEGLGSVHRLVQAVTVDQMAPHLARQWREAAAALIEAALPADPKQPATWPDFAVLLPHAQAVLAPDSYAMGEIGRYLGHSGSYRAARSVLETVLEARERTLGPEHPDSLGARHDLALWTGYAGDAAGARDQFAELLPVELRVLGAEHPGTLTARNNLAGWMGEAGDRAASRGQFARLLAVRKRVQGHEHPDTLTTWHNLAYSTGMAGDAASARDQFAMLLAVRRRILGVEHPDTLATRHSLAVWTASAGNLEAARRQLVELVPLFERVLGPNHPSTQTARVDLTSITEAAS